MVIDSHLHVLKESNFDKITEEKLGHIHPKEDTPLDSLVNWLRNAGITKAVIMGQDMSRIWNSSCGEDFVLECVRKYPELFIALASVEPINRGWQFNEAGLRYFEKAVKEYGFKGILFTPPYGQYSSDNSQVYPFYEKAVELEAIVQFHHCAHTGSISMAPFKYINPQSLNNILIDFPKMKVVVEHLNYPWYDELFFMMKACPNLYADLAMTYDRPITLTWNLIKAKEMGVINKIMYASDYWVAGSGVFSEKPEEDMKRWIKLIRTGLNKIATKCGWPTFTKEEIDGILYKNVANLYEISILSKEN